MLEAEKGSTIVHAERKSHVRVNERLIDALRLIVALLLLSHLLLEAQSLFEWVVQLRVCVAELLSTHEALETLAQTWPRSVPLG